MKAFFKEVIRINMMEQAVEKEAAAKEFFEGLKPASKKY